MLPRSVFHKKNGLVSPPASVPATSAEMLRRVHSLHARPPRVGADLLRFAHVIRVERRAALLAQAAGQVDGLRSALDEALARTRDSLDRGRLEDVRRLLERLKEEAEAVTRLVAELAAAAGSSGAERRAVSVDEILDQALERLPAGPHGPTVARAQAADVPPIAGHRRRLRKMFLVLLAGRGAAPGPVTVETSSRPGAMQGERIVRVRIVDHRSRGAARAADVRTAARIAAEHGGSLVSGPAGDHPRVFTIDLPAV
jgi:hypothetical protein